MHVYSLQPPESLDLPHANIIIEYISVRYSCFVRVDFDQRSDIGYRDVTEAAVGEVVKKDCQASGLHSIGTQMLGQMFIITWALNIRKPVYHVESGCLQLM